MRKILGYHLNFPLELQFNLLYRL